VNWFIEAMAEHNELGKLGESLAVAHLQKHGYEILETNWIFQKAEVDIIAQKGGVLAIIEVKTRSAIDFGLPQDFVNQKKIRLLVKAVDEYVISRNLDTDVRFDIIAIQKHREKYFIEHLEDAFFYF
jgi:putative endonuclease